MRGIRMRVFISLDLEGLPHVVSREHLYVRGALYEEARKIATEVVNVVAETLHENGADEIIIADSHGPMVNIIPEEMREYVSLVRGFPRPLSMVSGAKGSDFAVFLGYHAKAGTGEATFDHTYSSASIDRIEMNGLEVSETLLNALVLGEWDVPVAMVAGDGALIEADVRKYLPWAVGVSLKKSFGRYSSISPSLSAVAKSLKEGTEEAIKRWREGKIEVFTTEKPVEVRVRFLNTAFAEVASLLPFVSRKDGKTVEFRASSVEDALGTIEVLTLTSAGVSSIINR